MSIFTGVIIKLIYLGISLLVWWISYLFFVGAGLPSWISSILSFLAFLAVLAVLFPKVKEVIESIVETLDDLLARFSR